MCALLGDFNIDLINYNSHTGVSDFYDHMSTHGFRPLILQPTRVTSTSATLIDNIFINVHASRKVSTLSQLSRTIFFNLVKLISLTT